MRARELALVAAGGAVGALARYGISEAAPVRGGTFPVTTFVTNVAGAFVLGVLLELLHRRDALDHWARWLVGIGVLGALTTFSTFMVEVVELVRDGDGGTAAAYVVASLAVGLAAVVAGLWAAGWRGPSQPVPAEGES